MNEMKEYCREIIAKYLRMMTALGTGKVHAHEINFREFAKDAHEEPELAIDYDIDIYRHYILNLEFTVDIILESTERRISWWQNIQHQLEKRSIETEIALKLCFLAAEVKLPPFHTLQRLHSVWESNVIMLAISNMYAPRIKSNVQAEFYLRSADPMHRAKAQAYLAKNDNYSRANGLAA